jgi:hypothetical protein
MSSTIESQTVKFFDNGENDSVSNRVPANAEPDKCRTGQMPNLTGKNQCFNGNSGEGAAVDFLELRRGIKCDRRK